MENYSVRQLAKLTKVSVRTLHLYDQIGLLKPLARSRAGYRTYGKTELLRLQQILLYKELDMPLKQICSILDDTDFNLLNALNNHQAALNAKSKQLLITLATISKTIDHLKNNTIMSYEELYEGFSKEEAKAMHREALEKWPQQTEAAEKALIKTGKQNFKALQKEQQDITDALIALMNQDPESPAVQFEIARHYQNIRSFWGTQNTADRQAKQYAGLGDLYVADKRYTRINGEPNAEFGLFMNKAIKYFTTHSLN